MKVCSHCGTWLARGARHTCAAVQREREERSANRLVAWLVWGVLPALILIGIWVTLHTPPLSA
jgi:hypothetical protein